MNKLLTIIVPVYNEEKLVPLSIPPICNLPINKEVIVVNDGSKDNTAEELKKLQAKHNFILVNSPINSGKGAAIKLALGKTRGNFFVVCDADLEYDPEDLIILFSTIEKLDGIKMAIYGSRFINNRKISFHYVVNWFLTSVTNILFKGGLTDMETCFKMIPSSALNEIKLSGKRFEFEPEISAQLLKNGYEIKEVPISYRRRTYKEGKKITAKDGWLALKTLIAERFKK